MGMLHPVFNRLAAGKRKKSKLTKSQQALKEAEAKMLASHSKPLEKGAKANGLSLSKTLSKTPVLSEEAQSTSVDNNQLFQKLKGTTAPKPKKSYTGTKMLGTSQLHKSNEVPVFSNEEIVDIAKMRRG